WLAKGRIFAMTADVNGSSTELEEKRAPDAAGSCEDLPKPAATCDDVIGNGNGNAKDEGDGSYVFVTGDDGEDHVPVEIVQNVGGEKESGDHVPSDQPNGTAAAVDGEDKAVEGDVPEPAADCCHQQSEFELSSGNAGEEVAADSMVGQLDENGQLQESVANETDDHKVKAEAGGETNPILTSDFEENHGSDTVVALANGFRKDLEQDAEQVGTVNGEVSAGDAQQDSGFDLEQDSDTPANLKLEDSEIVDQNVSPETVDVGLANEALSLQNGSSHKVELSDDQDVETATDKISHSTAELHTTRDRTNGIPPTSLPSEADHVGCKTDHHIQETNTHPIADESNGIHLTSVQSDAAADVNGHISCKNGEYDEELPGEPALEIVRDPHAKVEVADNAVDRATESAEVFEKLDVAIWESKTDDNADTNDIAHNPDPEQEIQVGSNSFESEEKKTSNFASNVAYEQEVMETKLTICPSKETGTIDASLVHVNQGDSVEADSTKGNTVGADSTINESVKQFDSGEVVDSFYQDEKSIEDVQQSDTAEADSIVAYRDVKQFDSVKDADSSNGHQDEKFVEDVKQNDSVIDADSSNGHQDEKFVEDVKQNDSVKDADSSNGHQDEKFVEDVKQNDSVKDADSSNGHQDEKFVEDVKQNDSVKDADSSNGHQDEKFVEDVKQNDSVEADSTAVENVTQVDSVEVVDSFNGHLDGQSVEDGKQSDGVVVQSIENVKNSDSVDVDKNDKKGCLVDVSHCQDFVNGVEESNSVVAAVASVEGQDVLSVEGQDVLSVEGQDVARVEGQDVATEVVRRPFYYLIRIPRYDNENLKDEIKQAQSQVDEKTKARDAIRAEIQSLRVVCKDYYQNYALALSEERAARDLLKAKHKEIDSVKTVINTVKNFTDVEDIGAKIRYRNHMIQHETLSLKEEKQYIREINELKQKQEQLSSNIASQDELQKAMDQKDQAGERLKSLNKEVESLRDKFLKAQSRTKEAEKKYDHENERMIKLQEQFKAADVIRQEAYAHLQSLRKQLYDKNKYFWKYKDDAKAAYDLAMKGDKEALQDHCVNQVEDIMELWNKNHEFRGEYIRCNMRSTIRRLQTLDGRSLGPDEQPPAIPNLVSERVVKNTMVQSSTPSVEEQKPVVAKEESLKGKNTSTPKVEDQKKVKVEDQKNVSSKAKKPSPPLKDQDEHERQEEHKKKREEEELARKLEEAEELRKEKEAAVLKEQRRLEEKAKAKEAMERKKRNAEKAEARAALRAQKEAELKEKEREKKLRKKEKKKAVFDETNVTNEGECAPSIETPEIKETEIREKPVVVTKRLQRTAQYTKSKSVPPPLRNRGKKRIQTWMWIILAAILIFVLFFLVDSSLAFNLLGF
ncbi:hypothetical protein Tsubulata_039028, partial [Turnera subulata]